MLAAFFGRFYCGWICPINTVIKPTAVLSKALGLSKKNVPEFLKSETPRWIVFGLFVVGLIYTIYTISIGRKFPLPLIIIPLGIISTLFINENSWHRYLCPWGVLFSLTGRFSKRGIKSSNCISCSICEQKCPAEAIKVSKTEKAIIDPTYCLLCLDCKSNCPKNALSYGKIEK